MNFIALKMIVGDRMKYFSLVAGLAFATLLVTQQAAIFLGYSLRTGAWLRDTDVADLWVFDEQVQFADDFKPVLDIAPSRIRGIEGVQWAVPMFKDFVNVILPDGTTANVRLVGLDDATLMGGPTEMVQGKLEDLRQDRAIFVNEADLDDSLNMKRSGGAGRKLKIGDSVSVNDHECVVAGTYKCGKEFFWQPVIYTTLSRAQFMSPHMRRSLAYVFVKVRPGEDAGVVAGRIHESTGLAAMGRDQFERQSMLWIIRTTGILMNFGVTIVLGIIIGLLAAAQTYFTFILDNTRHFATLKAMGATGWKLVQMIFVQVAFVGMIGYGIGLGLSCIIGLGLQHLGLAFVMTWHIPLVSAVSIILCCTIAGIISLARVFRLEPAIVFK